LSEMGTQEMQWYKGSMFKVIKTFICRGCMNPVTGTGRTNVQIVASANLE